MVDFFFFRLFVNLVYKIGFCIVNNFKKKKKLPKKIKNKKITNTWLSVAKSQGTRSNR